MACFKTKINDKELEISAYSENAVRFRVSRDFEPTLFEKYGIYHKADDCGETVSNGVKAGDLTVTFDNGELVFSSSKVSRRITLGGDTQTIRAYMDEKLGGLRPEYRQIIGDEAKRNYGTVDFVKDPKYIEITTENEKFYGLGESNDDRLVLNGKAYLERVVYQRCEIPVPFLMTKAGYGILCNSTFWHGVDVCAKDENKIIWYLPDGDIDFIIFAGNTMRDVLERFTYVTGRPMLMPKWAHGLTFTEQYNSNQFEVMNTAGKFREKKMPCDMISLEPGWMAKRYDFSVEKKWNTDRFFINDWARTDSVEKHNKRFFSSALERYGFKLQLWLCSTHDFTAHEENLAGNETDFGIPVWFDHLRQFMNDGASSFKVDPCHVCDSADEARVYANGKSEPEMHNLMQTLCVKEMYQGSKAHAGRRPMHHFCGGYTSTGAYSAATTGDNGGGGKSLSWMLNLGLSGYSNISCDMDIFNKAAIHYGFFMSWSQLDAWSGYCHPWWVGDENEKIFAYYDNLRYTLMPYIYSEAIKTNMTGTPICRAIPLMFDDEECENSVFEYMFGENILVGAFKDEIFLPRGEEWYDAWTGKKYDGGKLLNFEIPSDRGGFLFYRAGAVVPTEAPKQFTDCKDTKEITLAYYPSDKLTTYDFYEDDGVSCEYLDGKRAVTKITAERAEKTIKLNIDKREGSFKGIGDDRVYSARVLTSSKPKKVLVNGKKVKFAFDENGFASFEIGNFGNVEIYI